MKDYIVLIEGSGEGCDHTIDCNKTWRFIRAESMKAAIKSLIGESPSEMSDEDIEYPDLFCDLNFNWNRYANRDDITPYSSVDIYEITQYEDVGEWCIKYQNEFKKRKEEIAATKLKDKEFEEYQRLKKKFDK